MFRAGMVAATVLLTTTSFAQDSTDSSSSGNRTTATPDDRPNPLRRATSPTRAAQASYNNSAEQPAYQRSPIDYFEAGSPSRQYPPGMQYQPTTGPYYDESPNRPSGIFQRVSASQPSDMQPARNMPSPASSFAEQGDAQGGDDCAPTYGGNGAQSKKSGAFHALPSNGTPQAFEPEHYPRALGFGEPLMGTSWQNRPFHVDIFSGTMIGDDAVDGIVGQEAGFFIGTRIGWDYDYYWGVETRLGLSWMSLFDRQNPSNNTGTGNIIVWDMSLLYYPWGDSRWRPFLLLGTGIQQLDSYGDNPAVYSGTLFELPFGAGMKYRMNEWLTFRFDVIDNWAFGTGSLDTMHNVSFTAGLEYHFGGKRRSYWPWNPNPKH
jgi:hypothetical protein